MDVGNAVFGDRLRLSISKPGQESEGTERLVWHTAAYPHTSIKDQALAQHAEGLADPGLSHPYWQSVRYELHPSSFALWPIPQL